MTNSWIDPVFFAIGPLQVRWYGLMYVAGFAVGSWLLTRLAKTGFWPLPKEAVDKYVTALIIGMFIGGLLPYLFTAFGMDAVGNAAGAVVREVRRQITEKPGILTGKDTPEYATCVDIVTKAALGQMIVPALLPLVFVVGTAFLGSPRSEAPAERAEPPLAMLLPMGLLAMVSVVTGPSFQPAW